MLDEGCQVFGFEGCMGMGMEWNLSWASSSSLHWPCCRPTENSSPNRAATRGSGAPYDSSMRATH